ncbi:MAG: hypothetical protein CME71_05595 [Halobacteriovorax sp.]|nr:hypothetical protein [Halobacteriovorax sp.]
MKINRFALVYLALVAFAFITVREVLHSSQFSNFVSKRLSKYIARDIGGEIKIGQIRMELFPFGMQLEDVQFKHDEIDLEFSYIAVNYGLQNAFKSDVYIEEVQLSQGHVKYESSAQKIKNETAFKEKLNLLRDEWNKNFSKLVNAPIQIQNLKLSNIRLNLNEQKVFVSDAHLFVDEDLHLKAQVDRVELESIDPELLPESFFVDVSLGAKGATLKKLSIQKGLANLEGGGNIHFYPEVVFDEVKIVTSGPDDSFTKWIPGFEKVDPLFESYVSLAVELSGPVIMPKAKVLANIEELSSKFLNAKKVSLSAEVTPDTIIIGSANVTDGVGTAEIQINQPVSLSGEPADLELKNMIVTLTDLPTSTVFHFLQETLKPFRANLSGKINVDLNKRGLVIRNQTPLSIANLSLELGKGEPLLAHPNVFAKKLKLDLDFEPFKLQLLADLNMGESVLVTNAMINTKGIQASLVSDSFSFDEIKKISSVELAGRGDLSVGVNGTWDNVVFDFNGKMAGTKVSGYDLGSIIFTGQLPLQSSKLSFPKIEGRKGFTRYTGAVDLDIKATAYPLAISFDASRATFIDLKEIIAPIVPQAVLDAKDLQARFSTKGKVSVDFDNRPVKLDIEADGESLSFYGEYFDAFNTKLRMNAGRLNIRELNLRREGVNGRGQLIWDTDSNYLEYEFSMGGMSLMSFNAYRLSPLSLEGNLELDLYGSGIIDNDHSLRATLSLQDSTIKRRRVANSKLDAYYSRGEWTFQGELMEGLGRLEAFIPVNHTKKPALVRVDVTAANIKPLVGLLAPVRMNEPTLNGRAFFQMQASFPTLKPELADIKLDIRDVLLSYKSKNVRVSQKTPLLVKQGVFEGWSLTSSTESELVFLAKAQGHLGGNFSLFSSYTVPAEFFELVSDRFVDMSGTLDGRLSVDWSEDGVKSFINHNARDVQFRLKDIPGKFSEMVLDIALENNEIKIQDLSGKYGRGDFGLKGKVAVRFPYPSVDLRLSFNDVTYPLFNRSNVTFDSRLSLIGAKAPYLFAGNVSLEQVNLIDDVGTYLGEVKTGSSYERFIPNTTQSLINQYLEIDVGVISNNTIAVKNPLMDLNLGANLKLNGELMTPRIGGRIYGSPGKSKVAFKGHEFVLSKSNVSFAQEDGPSKANLDLSGRASVAGYSIDLLVNGAADQMNIVLSSDPALPQDEIVSLLTLGITSDISRNLNEEDRRSITTMSLGGFLFDQLQLTRDLDSNLGLKVSLAPEFSSEEGNLIEEASSDTSGSRRLKTGTKLRVQSQVGKKTSVSFSSTLGGEVEQKQEMNVNYDFNRAWSLEGVYEIKSSVEENQGGTQSLGADVKYRWSF